MSDGVSESVSDTLVREATLLIADKKNTRIQYHNLTNFQAIGIDLLIKFFVHSPIPATAVTSNTYL